MQKKKKKILRKKVDFFGHFSSFYGQRSVTAAWAKKESILKGLGVGPGSATERWPCRKIARKAAFLDIPSSYAKILGGNFFQPREFLRSG